MPKDFTRCVDEGGKVITKTLPEGRYIHLCKDKSGKWHEGEVKKKKSNGFLKGK